MSSFPSMTHITKKHCVIFTQCFFILGVWFKFYSLSHTPFFILREIKAMNEMTLAEWLDKWYDLYAKPFLKTSTLVSYNGYISKLWSCSINLKTTSHTKLSSVRDLRKVFQVRIWRSTMSIMKIKA